MPNNKNKNRGQNDRRNNFYEHDDRSDRKVRFNSNSNFFKKNKFNNKGKNKDWGESLRHHLEDEDIDMSGASSHTRNISKRGAHTGSRKGGRTGSPAPNEGKKNKLFEGPTNWYKVILPYGNKYDKDYICKTLQANISPMPLIPISWRPSGNQVTFFVDDFKIAEKLKNADKTITCPDGFKMIIKVFHGLPQVDLNAEVKEAMKQAMAKRYNPVTKALDMTKFHADPNLGNYFCALFKPVIMLAALDIISENIPELEALNLQENRIAITEHLKDIKNKTPNLKILHLGHNKIRDVSQLDALKGLPIIDLLLDGNPLCDKFKEQTQYVSEIRKRFPKVLKLDGVDLPPPISFDLNEEIPMPTSQQTFLSAPEGQEVVRQFLEQYFLIYDSDSRQPLLQAYHEHAMFSMTMAYPYGMTPKNSSWLNWYQTDNRNLLRVQDTERRHRLLRQGNLAVVSFLQEMPKTKHDIHSFTVDLSVFTPALLMLTVTGIFRELESGQKQNPLRAFSRVLIIVPAGSGFCIVNEQLFISNATEAQQKVAFKTQILAPPSTPVNTPNTSVHNTSITSPNVSIGEPDVATKQQMVQALSQQTGMNLDFSTKCLTETTWDFQRAVFIFTELHKDGRIPAEAFVK